MSKDFNIYVCGPTVYSDIHIGNLRPIITFDIFARAKKALGYNVNFVNNITDIDDKIINKARENGVEESIISKKYFFQYKKLISDVNVSTITLMPSVVESMDIINNFIERLVENNNAYSIRGTYYFDISKIENYGHISNRNLSDQKFVKGLGKHHPADFAIWKDTSLGIKFISNIGKGRPGWHTECAALIDNIFKGKQIDIHGGGNDLKFPHHENENSQFFALNNLDITREWKHTGMINVDNVKMSKSIGNIFYANDFINKFDKDFLRWIILNTSPSSPIDFNDNFIGTMEISFSKIKNTWRKFFAHTSIKKNSEYTIKIANLFSSWDFSSVRKILADLNKKINKEFSIPDFRKFKTIVELAGFKFSENVITNQDNALFLKWEKYKLVKNYEKADKIRKILSKKGLV